MKNIIFDLGGVLLKGTPSSFLKKELLNNKEYNMLLSFFDNWENLDLGNESLEDKFLKCKIDNKYKNILLNYYEKRDINMDLINLSKKLKSNGYKLYILSDNNKESSEYYKSNKLFDSFDGWVISCDYKTVKKDGRLFEIMLEKYNLKPNECFFIDDNTVNVEVAKRYGIKGFVYNENDDITKLYECMIDNEIKLE